MRVLDSATLAALAGATVGVAQLVEMDLDPPLYLNTTGWDLSWDGNTYLGTYGAGTIDTLEDTTGDIKGLNFSLPAIITADIATALIGMPMGAGIRLKTAIFDAVTNQIIDAPLEWAGRLDVPQITETAGDSANGAPTSAIQVSAEHIGVDLMRPGGLLYTNADQLLLYPLDRSFEYIVAQANAVIVWPAASYFKK